MSDALLAIASAVVTTIGLAIVNKMMSRPAEHWKQASEMRGELRIDLERSCRELDVLRDKSRLRDLELMDLKEQMIEVNIKLRAVSSELRHCLESHQRVDGELGLLKIDLKTCIRSVEPV